MTKGPDDESNDDDDSNDGVGARGEHTGSESRGFGTKVRKGLKRKKALACSAQKGAAQEMALLRSFPTLEPCLAALDKFVRDTNLLASLPKTVPENPAAAHTDPQVRATPSQPLSQLSRVQPSLRQACYISIMQSVNALHGCLVGSSASNSNTRNSGSSSDRSRRRDIEYSIPQLQQLVETFAMGGVSDGVQEWLRGVAVADRLFPARTLFLTRLHSGGQQAAGVPACFCCDQQQAVDELNLVQYSKSPVDKMLRFAAVVAAVEEAVEKHLSDSSSEKEFATDDLILVLVWVVSCVCASSSSSSSSVLSSSSKLKQYTSQQLTADVQFCVDYHFPLEVPDAHLHASASGREELCLCHFRVAENYLQENAVSVFDEHVLKV